MSDATDMLARIEAQPLRLSNGRDLQDWLGHETALGPERAAILIREYRRFLALAATAEPGAPAMPSPMVQLIWRIHRDDTAAYEAFRDALAAPRLNHRLSHWQVSRADSYKATRSRYCAAFGPPPHRWWPRPLLLSFRQMLELLTFPFLWVGLTVWTAVSGMQRPGAALVPFEGAEILLLLVIIYVAFAFSMPLGFRVYGPPRGSLAVAPGDEG